jgi:hypothetical protein
MHHHTRKVLCWLLLGSLGTLPLQAHDAPETLAWVERIGVRIDNVLQDAVGSNDHTNLLIKLMECHDEFDAVALAGLHCHEARIAAEMGRHACNWLNSFAKDKDLNACILRAQEAREQALKMASSARSCLETTKTGTGITLADLIRQESAAVRNHLDIAEKAPSHLDYYFQLEQVYRLLNDLAHLTATLSKCEQTHLATANASNECLLALYSKNNRECEEHMKQIRYWLALVESGAATCM